MGACLRAEQPFAHFLWGGVLTRRVRRFIGGARAAFLGMLVRRRDHGVFVHVFK